MVRRFLWILPFILLALLAAGFGILAKPFSREAMATTLGDALASKVVFGAFRRTYLPAPGFVATNVKILPKQGWSAGHAEIETLRTEATWGGLLRHQVGRITAQGLTITVRSLGEHAFVGELGSNLVERLELRRAALQVDGRCFDFHRITLQNIGPGQRVSYELAVAIPQPAGELALSGQVGPFHRGQFEKTPVGGKFVLTRANLGVFHGIAGTLSSKGTFSGALSQIDFEGGTDVPDFEVTESGHKHSLTTHFQAKVNATNGNTFLSHIDARLDRTSMQARGEIASRGSERTKTVNLNIDSGQGRIQDLMLLFIRARESPILGPIGFRAKVVLPPGARPFKQRVELTGRFGINNAGFTSADTQTTVDTLSVRAQGEPHEVPERVLSDLAGQVILHDGIARLSDVSFRIPGAVANLSGTFDLMTERIDLHGKLDTAAKLSKTTTGIKSVFLKVLDPVFKRKQAGAVIPVAVTGKYGATEFHQVFTK